MNGDRFNCLCYSAVLGFAIFVLFTSIKLRHEEKVLRMKLEAIEVQDQCEPVPTPFFFEYPAPQEEIETSLT